MDALHENIGREVGVFTTALFPVDETRPRLDPPGTGTFVSLKGLHYILTAAHVWDRVVCRGPDLGITIKEGLDCRFLIHTKDIQCFSPTWPDKWNEWGPDIALLRLPIEVVDHIKVYRGFYDLDKAPFDTGDKSKWTDAKPTEVLAKITERRPGQRIQIEGRVLTGCPCEHGLFTQTHADIQITAMFLGVEDAQRHSIGAFDYVDLDIDGPSPGVPQSFEGVSGGGLWRYFTTISDGEERTYRQLEGVAFYQLVGENERVTLRCHSVQSIEELKRIASPAPTESIR